MQDDGRASDAGFAVVRESARRTAFDRYLAALLAPAGARTHLVTLAAYGGELARIPLTVKDPRIAEIRLQWWHDAVEGFASGARTGNPIADRLARTAHECALPRDLLLQPVLGRVRELYDDGVADEASFRAYLDETEGAAFRLALKVLDYECIGALDTICAAAAAAWGLTRLAVALPIFLSHNRLPLGPRGIDPRQSRETEARWAARHLVAGLSREARKNLADFRRMEPTIPKNARPAFLPLALVGPYFRAIESPRHDALTGLVEIFPFTRVWRLWLAHWRGRI